VVNLVAGSKHDLKTGAHAFIPRWEKQGDGTWMATVVVVGREEERFVNSARCFGILALSSSSRKGGYRHPQMPPKL
jgi:hypothetical protein